MTMMSYWLLLLLVQVIVRASFCEFRTHKLLIRKELRVLSESGVFLKYIHVLTSVIIAPSDH